MVHWLLKESLFSAESFFLEKMDYIHDECLFQIIGSCLLLYKLLHNSVTSHYIMQWDK